METGRPGPGKENGPLRRKTILLLALLFCAAFARAALCESESFLALSDAHLSVGPEITTTALTADRTGSPPRTARTAGPGLSAGIPPPPAAR